VPFGFLRRGRRSASRGTGGSAASSQDAPTDERGGVPFDGLTEDWRLLGVMEIDGRMSDVLNRREPIPIADMTWAPIDGSQPFVPAPGLQRVDPYDLIVVLAGDSTLPPLSEAERAAIKVHKVPYDVVLEAPPFKVLGTVYLYPGSEPERLLDRSTELFVPVTSAVAMIGERPVGDPDVDVVLVNRSYLRTVSQVEASTLDDARQRLRTAAEATGSGRA
jgi:hypothetical protein